MIPNTSQRLLVVVFLALPSTGLMAMVAQAVPSTSIDLQLSHSEAQVSAPATTTYTYITVITVTSGADPDNSLSETCVSDSPCTLRHRAGTQRPGRSAPCADQVQHPYHRDAGLFTHPGHLENQSLDDQRCIGAARLNGQIVIDGETQPGGRTAGPKIVLVGPSTGQKDGLVVGDVAGNNNHVIRGLGFQNFKTHMFVNTNNNVIEDNWFGLTDDGSAPYLRNDNPQNGSGSGGIDTSGGTTGASNNLIQNNVFLGFDGMALSLKGGSGNTVRGNFIGANASGLVTGKQSDPGLRCTTVDWLGGGISLAGIDQRVENNVIAGLRQEISASSTQPDAIRVTVTGDAGHVIQNNRIGVDAGNAEVGVCSRGLYLTGDMQNTQVISNVIVDPGLSGMSLNDLLYDAATLRRNVIKRTSPWPAISGNPKPEDAINWGHCCHPRSWRFNRSK